MHLDRPFELALMGVFHVGIASADMGDHHGILAGHRVENIVRGVAFRARRARALDQDV